MRALSPDAGPLVMTTLTDARPATSMIEGWLDFASAGRAFGWACDRTHPDDTLEVEIRLSSDDGSTGRPLATTAADRPREDLKAGGFGSGLYGFECRYDLPEGADPTRVVALARSPRTGACTMLGHAGAAPQAPRGTGDGGMGAHLQRIVGGLAVVRREQAEQMAAVKADLRQELSRVATRTGAEGADLRRMSDGIEGLQERLAAVEVFLVRIDGALRDLDASVRKGRVAERPGLARLVLIGGAGVASVGLCAALAIHAFG